jgi:hypothetical protein
MAVTEITTRIANPAKGKKKRRNKMAKPRRRNLSAKQIAAGFGGKRRQSAVKSSRKRKRNRARPAAKKHRARTKPNGSGKFMRRAKKTIYGTKLGIVRKRNKARRRKNGSAKRRAAKRQNPGAIYALVNPARKRSKNVARRKKNRGGQRRKNPAGRTHRRKNAMHHRQRNPGMFGTPKDWLSLGAGAVVGGLGATTLPQLVLSSSNTGPVGYLGMAASTAILAVAGHMLFGKNVMLTSGIIAGGAGALIKRILGDYTPLGQYLGSSGMGDYLTNFQFATPQIIGGNGNNAIGAAGTIPVNVAGAGMNTAGLTGRALY